MTRRWPRVLIAVIGLLVVTGCTTATPLGECIGAFDDPDPALVYRTSGWNVALAIVFFETLAVPVNVIGWNARCPVARKPDAKRRAVRAGGGE